VPTLAVLLALAACSLDSGASSSTPTSSAGAQATSAAPTATEFAEPTSPEGTDSVEPTEGPETGPTDTGTDPTDTATPSAVPTDRIGQPLGLNDAFAVSQGWTEERWSIASQKDVRAMGATLTSCGPDEGAQLDFRLRHDFHSLSMKVGQADTSQSSDSTLVVEVIGNGKQREIRQIRFDVLQPITVSVDDVNALQIRLYLDPDDEDCTTAGSVIGTISALTLS
jgi:hypothetical protein